MTTDRGSAIVTGAGRGIGRAIAHRLAADGFTVTTADISAELARTVAKEIGDQGYQASPAECDVRRRDAVGELVADTRDRHGDLAVMVANAGIVRVGPLLDVNADDLDAVLGVNVAGVLWSIQAAAAAMIEQGGGGRIIAAGSVGAHSGSEYLASYCASKFGVRALVQVAARELARHRITVNAYCPGIVGTDMWTEIDRSLGRHLGTGEGEALERYSQMIALGRVQTPEDVAGLVSYLAGPDGGYMTGQSVVVDGGIVMV
ncbi:acetoin reductase [Pseudonocardia sp. NPDC049154]|uniref:acetoin reductase n=1 Tax=Pseudonocardia sp. NPDC049154 TaxID=3155501 RepID=UPI00340ECFAE